MSVCANVVDAEPLLDNFLLFVDPLQKAMYQLDAGTEGDDDGPRQIRAIDLSTSTYPIFVGFDLSTGNVYWHDDGPIKNSIKFKRIDSATNNEGSLSVFSGGRSLLFALQFRNIILLRLERSFASHRVIASLG